MNTKNVERSSRKMLRRAMRKEAYRLQAEANRRSRSELERSSVVRGARIKQLEKFIESKGFDAPV